MAYERVPDVTLPPDVCHQLVRRARDLPRDCSVGAYQTSPSDRTIALYAPVLSHVFPGRWVYANLIRLLPGMTIPYHTDGEPQFRRRHLVLQTNDMVWVFHDGGFQQLDLGGVYRMDPTKPHGAVNWGAEERIHLFVDTLTEEAP